MLLFLVVPFGLLWVLFAAHRDRIGFGNMSVRGAFVLAYLAFQVLVLVITEVTSIGHHFTAGAVAGAWAAVAVVLLLAAKSQVITFVKRARLRHRMWASLRERVRRVGVEDRIWVGVVVVIFGVLVVEGSSYPPAYTDAMVYHLARVEHWIQNRTVAPFATHYLSQIELAPLSEYNLAHLHLLLGTDRLDWSVQWLSAVVCVVGASELARLLGGSRFTQIAASVVCATIPSGLLLATSTGNDYFAAAIGIGLLTVLAAFSFDGRWWPRAVALAVAAGLAYMAKGTTPEMLGPAALALLGVAVYRRLRSQDRPVSGWRVISWCAVVGVSLIAVAGPFMVQNSQLFGLSLGPTSDSKISSPLRFDGMAANVIRATAQNFDIGNGVSGLDTYVSMAVLGVSRHVYSLFGLSYSDPHYCLSPCTDPFRVGNYESNVRIGELGANPWHVLLLIFALVALVVVVLRGSKRSRVPLILTVGLICGFVLFRATAKWGGHSVRYSLPLLVAGAAVIALALALFPRWVGRFVLLGLVVACLPQLLDNFDQPLVPLEHFPGSYLTPYFAQYSGSPIFSQAEVASGYQTVTSMMAQSTCRRAAIGNWIYLEYPLWVGLQHVHWNGQLNDFDVTNVTRKLEPHYTPCAWLTEEGPAYVTPRNGTVNVQPYDLALSMVPSHAATIREAAPGMESTVAGVRVLPGGGWELAANLKRHQLKRRLQLNGNGSLYLFSASARRVQLELHPVPGPQRSVVLSGPGGRVVSTVDNHDVLEAALNLRRGVNRIDLTTGTTRTGNGRALALTGVTVDPAGA